MASCKSQPARPDDTPRVPALDRSRIEQLEGALGDSAPEVIAELVALLADDGPKQLQEILRGVQAGDPERVWRPAHQLKSSSAAMGAAELSRLCLSLEMMGRQGDLALAAETLPQASAAFEGAIAALRALTR